MTTGATDGSFLSAMAAQGLVVNALVMSMPPKVTVVAAVTKATAQPSAPTASNVPVIVGELGTLAAILNSCSISHCVMIVTRLVLLTGCGVSCMTLPSKLAVEVGQKGYCSC